MHMTYVHEEVTIERTVTKRENAEVWEKESKFFSRLQDYYEALQQATQEHNADEEFADVEAFHFVLDTRGGSHDDFTACWKAVWKGEHRQPRWEPVTAADAFADMVEKDETHCMELRVIIEDEDLSERPVVISKVKEEQAMRYGVDAWQNEKTVTETDENWSGQATCALFLPNTNCIPAEIEKAYHQLEAMYCDEGSCGHLLENQIEEYEGNMEGGAFESFSVQGPQLADFLARMQQLSDLAQAHGGSWTLTGYQCSDEVSLLSYETDDEGKIKARYLKP